MLLANVPIQSRHSSILIPKLFDNLIADLVHCERTDSIGVRSVCMDLLTVLRDSSEDIVRELCRKRDSCDATLFHIAVTAVPKCFYL